MCLQSESGLAAARTHTTFTTHIEHTEHNKGSSAFEVAKSSPVLFFHIPHTHTHIIVYVKEEGKKLKINKSRAKSCLWQQVRGGWTAAVWDSII